MQIISREKTFASRTVQIANDHDAVKDVFFHLVTDENVLGMPRLLFVVTVGCLGVLIIACCAFSITFYQRRKLDRSYYSFSMLPQHKGGEMKKLFEDEDEMDETELFRTPIKSKNLKIEFCLPKVTSDPFCRR